MARSKQTARKSSVSTPKRAASPTPPAESQQEEKVETKPEKTGETKEEGQAKTKVYTLRFEEGDSGNAVTRSRTIGSYSTKEQAIKSASAAMGEKCSWGDVVNDREGIEGFRTEERNTNPKTCPDEGFIFDFVYNEGTFSQTCMSWSSLDVPYKRSRPLKSLIWEYSETDD